MILTTHLLAGAFIGKNLTDPVLIALSSFSLHFLMDWIPHGEYLNRNSSWKESWKVAVDLLIGFSIILLISETQNWSVGLLLNVGWGAFFSILPDFLTLAYWKLKIKPLGIIFKFHQFCHKYPPFSPQRDWNLKNAANDILLSVLGIGLLFF